MKWNNNGGSNAYILEKWKWAFNKTLSSTAWTVEQS